MQNESALDYLKIEEDAVCLNAQIEQADGILAQLENILLGFQENLNFIKDDMTSLQKRSLNMNISLKNRKEISDRISEFVEGSVLEPELIADICNKEIDEHYVLSINRLRAKIEYLSSHQQEFAGAALTRELEPELQRLNRKACQRSPLYLECATSWWRRSSC